MSLRRCCLVLLIAAGCTASSPIDTGNPDPAGAADAAGRDAAVADGARSDAAVPADAGADLAGPLDQAADLPAPGSPAHAFILTATLQAGAAGAGAGNYPYPFMPPAEDRFTIYVDDAAKHLIASRTGAVAKVAIKATSRGWQAGDTFGLRTPSSAHKPCEGVVSMTYSRFEFAIDGDRMTGTVEGAADYESGDAVTSLPFHGTFTGAPDREPPVLSVESVPPHPADIMVIVASEALPPGTVADLVRSDGIRQRLGTYAERGEPIVSFLTGGLGARTGYHLELGPALVDYAGNRGDLTKLPAVDTRPVPLVSGGFEGDPLPLLDGPAAVVGGERFPPIAGQRSLLFPSNTAGGPARASMRVKVTPGQTVIHATVRTLSMMGFPGNQPQMKAVAPDGSSTPAKLGQPQPPFTPVAGGFMLGSPQTLEFEMPPGAKDEVMIDIRTGLDCGVVAPTLGLLIDELGTAP